MIPNVKGLSQLMMKIQYLFLALLVFRIGSFIAVPGVNPAEVARLLSSSNTLFGLFNTFSGGALSRLSLFTTGIMPYITMSIIVNVLSTFHPHFEQLKKEGDIGRRKIAFYTRVGTLLLSIFYSLGTVRWLASNGVIVSTDPFYLFIVVLSFVTGTMTLMWIGEQISEKGLGQGTSLIIFIGIVAGLPGVLGQSIESIRYGTLAVSTFAFSLALLLAALYAIIFVERAQRNIPVHYARRVPTGPQGSIAQQRSDLPLKINMVGVMPSIFASNLVVALSTIAQFFSFNGKHQTLSFIQENLSSGKPLFMVVFTVAIIFFAFYYTAAAFNPYEIADNLKKSGGVIQGIRPGASTAHYIHKIMARLTLLGAIYIAAVSLLPEILNYFGTIPFSFGGTSLLIVAVVVMDFFSQIQTHLFSAQYENVLKRYQPKKNRLN
jgi:preprotein translocase subunit SecY